MNTIYEFQLHSPDLYYNIKCGNNNENVHDLSQFTFTKSQWETIQQVLLFFDKFATKYSSSLAYENINNWNVNQLQSYLKQNYIDVKPIPQNKDVLLKAVTQLRYLQHKIVHIIKLLHKNDDSVTIATGKTIFAKQIKQQQKDNVKLFKS